MRRRAQSRASTESGGGGICPGVVGGRHVLSRIVCLKHARQGSADVSYNGRGTVDCTRLSGGCRFVVSSGVQLQRCVYGRLSLVVQYYLRKGWTGSQTRVYSTVYVGDRRHEGGRSSRLIMVIYASMYVSTDSNSRGVAQRV